MQKIFIIRIIHILLLSLLIIPQFFIDKRMEDSWVENYLGGLLLVATAYTVAIALSADLKRQVEAKSILAYLPCLIPLVFCTLPTPYIVFSYFAILPSGLIIRHLINGKSFTFWRILNICIISYIWISGLIEFHKPVGIYFDLWQLYDLSKTFTEGEFYKINFVRQVEAPNEYCKSFPLGYPALLALFDNFTSIGIRGFYLINYGCFFLSFLLIRRLCHHANVLQVWGVIILTVFTLPEFAVELNSGGTTQFSFLSILGSLCLLCSKSFNKALDSKKTVTLFAIFQGFILGSACLIRFDFLAIALSLIALWITFLLYRKDIKAIAAICIAFLLSISPWIIYSLLHFDHPFVSDNSRRILSIPLLHPFDYYADPRLIETIFTHPTKWIEYKYYAWVPMVKEFIILLKNNPLIILLPLYSFYLVLTRRAALQSKRLLIVSCIVLGITALYIPILFTVGYRFNVRYYCPFLATLCTISIITIAGLLTQHRKHSDYAIIACILILTTLSPSRGIKTDIISKAFSIPSNESLEIESFSTKESNLYHFIRNKYPARTRMMYHITNKGEFFIERFASRADLAIMSLPGPGSQKESYGLFIKEYKPNLILIDELQVLDQVIEQAQKEDYTITPTEIPDLYIVDKMVDNSTAAHDKASD